MTLATLRVGTSLGLCLWLVACDCHAGLPELFYDDLQSVCTGAPCDWQVEAGTVTSVATFHQTERGMRLSSGARVAHVLDFEIPGATNPQAAPAMHLLAACGSAETRLHFTLELVAEDASEALEAGFAAAPDDDDPLPLRHIELLGPGGTAPGEGRARRLIIEVEGPDDCTIDELRIVEKTGQSDC